MQDDFLRRMRHSAAHVLALAVLRLYPNTKLGIGPATDTGFYYDFLFEKPITTEDLAKIEEEMKKIISQGLVIKRVLKSRKDAIEFYKNWDQPFKLELLEEIKDDPVSFYVLGNDEFIDLCKGPHVDNTAQIGAVKLLNIAGAYWRGDEKRPMLTRIYGTAFPNQEDLENYLKVLELAKKHDHRELNKRLGYYFIDPELIGSGLVVWLPRGAYLKRQLEEFILEKYLKSGHEYVSTPHVAKQELWQTSGHLGHYKDSMFPEMVAKDGNTYYVKPMNCPLHVQIYKRAVKSYRQLPFRVTDIATVYRYEKPGELHGLTRVRGLTQDDGHIFCTREQVESELDALIKLANEVYAVFGFEDMIEADLSFRGSKNQKKYLGDDKLWDTAQKALESALKRNNLKYTIQEGEAAFYGPKIDIHLRDAIGRRWQMATIQLDFNLPERFGLRYIGEDGKEHTPVMIHRALFGSSHRFIGILIEVFGGNLPLWLEYEKVWILPISEKHLDYAKEVQEVLKSFNIDSKIIYKNEPLQGRIREAEELKIPYQLIVGDKEQMSKGVSVRVRGRGNIGLVSLEDFATQVRKEIDSKMVNSIFTQHV